MGIGMPDPIGSAPPPQEPDDDDMGQPGGGATLSPETVKYHEGPQNCGNCMHMQGGHCEVIGRDVADEGGCDVWEGGGGNEAGGLSPVPPAGSPMGSGPPGPMR